MWCGNCYTSDPDVVFHVQPPGYEGEEGQDPELVERLGSRWGKKHQDKSAYLHGRNGDHTMVPFECDLCVFRKVSGRSAPAINNAQDRLLQAAIRRVILDAFWSRTSNTVESNANRIRMGLAISETLGLEGPYIHEGPLPSHDHCGYEVAIQMVIYSRREGRNSKTHLQPDSIRRLRSAYGNQARSSAQATRHTMALGDQKGRYQRFATDPTGSFWFSRFYQGLLKRMGQVWKPNRAMSMKLFLAVLNEVEARIAAPTSTEECNNWVVFHSYAVVSYVVSLRGAEGMLLDLGGLNRHWKRTRDYVVIALLGKVKGENNDRSHLLPCVNTTSSGVRVRQSIERLLRLKQHQKLTQGPAVSDEQGVALSSRDVDGFLHDVLEVLFETAREMFPPNVESLEDVQKNYQAFRSFRRTSDTRAIEKGVSHDDIDVVNRWQKTERSGGSRPDAVMRQRYAQFDLLLAPFLRYTEKM